jgi:metal-responsive CopG/Arc/MetJ family transcriptional regulator
MPRPKPEEQQVLVTLWIAKPLLQKADKVAKKDKFAGRSAFIREAIANEVDARTDDLK